MKREAKYYKKSIITKEKLIKAFFFLYKNNKIESINVKEITDKAGYNRGTFYIYFKSIYDLLKQAETELLVEFQAHTDEFIKLFYGHEHSKEILQNIASLFDKYDKYLQPLLGENGDPLFQYQIKAILKKAYVQHLGINEKDTDKTYKYILEYMTQANISIIGYWLNNRKQGSNFSDILSILHDINTTGANNVLLKYTK